MTDFSKEICDKCGKRQKRYWVAFGSYFCDNCKVETFREIPNFEVCNLWASLSKEKKEEIYKNNKVNGGHI